MKSSVDRLTFEALICRHLRDVIYFAFGSWVCKNARPSCVAAAGRALLRFLAGAGRFSGFSACGRFWRAPMPWNGDLGQGQRDFRLNGRLTP